jgi:hypothetical protein|tara:strand:+ start:103 stop:273 length:171 start_codon:yes stop_codon:yes gene_type:complete
MSNIEDVTNSPKDWEDFWYNSESDGQEFEKLPPYLEAVLGLSKYPADCKRESPLSE